MYERFRSQIINQLRKSMTQEEIDKVTVAMDIVATKYKIEQFDMALVPCGYDETPEAVKMYVASRAVEGMAKSSLGVYRTILDKFFKTIRKSPAQITQNDVRVWLYMYQKEHGAENRTLELYRQILASFFDWAQAEGLVQESPCERIKKIKYTKKPRFAIAQVDLEHIRLAAKDERESAIIETLYSTGCRVSELVGIKLNDINWQTNEVLIYGKGGKYRTVYLNAKAQVAIQQYLSIRKDGDPHLFVGERSPHKGLTKNGVEAIVRKISERAYAQTGKNVTLHVFRHTTATTALQNGMPVQDIQKILGHSSIATTMIYAEVNQASVKAMHGRCVV